MRAAWIDAGNDPEYERLRAAGVGGCYFDLREDRLSAAYLAAVRAAGFSTGVYFAGDWYSLEARKLAEHVSKELERIAPKSGASTVGVCADLEMHDAAYVGSFFTRWRELRPTRLTFWTLEGFQAGWFTPALVAILNTCRVIVVPQFYTGTMAPLAADRCALELVARGISPLAQRGFYDAAALPAGWDGFAFTQGRLPPP